ncbi:hypothetical protein P3L10_020064 [Capsicum annuum]
MHKFFASINGNLKGLTDTSRTYVVIELKSSIPDFGSVDFMKMSEMQMQMAGFVSSYFGGCKVRIFLLEMEIFSCFFMFS